MLIDLVDDERLARPLRDVLTAEAHKARQAPPRHWAAPEFMRVAAATAKNDIWTDAIETERRLILRNALELPKTSGVPAWDCELPSILQDVSSTKLASPKPGSCYRMYC